MSKIAWLVVGMGWLVAACGDDTGAGGSGAGTTDGGSSEGGSSSDGGSAQGGSSPNAKCVANCQRDEAECPDPSGVDCQVTCDSQAITNDACPSEWGAYEDCRANATDFCPSDTEEGECSTELAALNQCSSGV